MALRGGDRTAYLGGQVSLNPIPHIRREPVGMVLLPLLSIVASGWPLGFASAPFDPHWALRHPHRAGRMALAGPAGNLVLVLVAALTMRAGLSLGVLVSPEAVGFDSVVAAASSGVWVAVAPLASIFFSLNLLLAAFNLLPVPPLDGSGAATLLMNESTARRYQEILFSNRFLAFLGILLAWRLFDPLFQPLWLGTVNLIHTTVQYG